MLIHSCSIKIFTEPDMWTLIKIVVPKIKAEWELVAFSMNYDLYTVKAIREDYQNEKECCKRLFEDWLSSSRGVKPKTWNVLLGRIKHVPSLRMAAESIEKQLIAIVKTTYD